MNPPLLSLWHDPRPVSCLHHCLSGVGVSACLYLSSRPQSSQSVSHMSQCFSCHGSAHKCLFVSLSSLQTQVLHRPVNGFVRWPFHRASHEDRQRTAISLCVSLCVSVSTCVCFSHRHQDSVQEIKGHPSIRHSHVSARFLRVAFQSGSREQSFQSVTVCRAACHHAQ